MEYWETRWQNGQTGWDLNGPSPALVAYLEQIPPEKRNLHILMPGCGNGHEAVWMAKNGFTKVEMLDIAPTAVETLRKRLTKDVPDWEKSIHLRCGDFFELEGKYDLVLEQTFFCAIDPSLRQEYVRKMAQLLNPNGRLVGLLFNRRFEGGPPFGGFSDEYLRTFSPFFSIHTLAPCHNSYPARAGSEVFVNFQRR